GEVVWHKPYRRGSELPITASLQPLRQPAAASSPSQGSLLCRALPEHLVLEDADVGEVAVVVGVVQAVAHHKVVRALEAHIVRREVGVVAHLLVEEGDGLHALGTAGGEEVFEVLEGEAGVDDVVDDDDVPAGDVHIHVLVELHHARGLAGGAVAGHGDEVHVDVEVDLPAEVGEEEGRALEDAHHHRPGALVVFGDLLAQGFHHGGNLLFGVEDGGNVVFFCCDPHVASPLSKASPHNCVCGLRPIFCPIRAVIKGGNTYSIPALL